MTGLDSGFNKGRGWHWYLRVAESMKHATEIFKFEN